MEKKELEIKLVENLEELQGIKSLQENNLKENVTELEKQKEGFVTAKYSIDFLQDMHRLEPSSIAKAGGQIVGYILAAPPSIRSNHYILGDLADMIDLLSYQGTLLKNVRYIMAGQVCIDKQYRSRGLLPQIYECFRLSLQNRYDCCITEVDDQNPRSLRAHLKCGFQIIHSTTAKTDSNGPSITWHILLWNWSLPPFEKVEL